MAAVWTAGFGWQRPDRPGVVDRKASAVRHAVRGLGLGEDPVVEPGLRRRREVALVRRKVGFGPQIPQVPFADHDRVELCLGALLDGLGGGELGPWKPQALGALVRGVLPVTRQRRHDAVPLVCPSCQVGCPGRRAHPGGRIEPREEGRVRRERQGIEVRGLRAHPGGILAVVPAVAKALVVRQNRDDVDGRIGRGDRCHHTEAAQRDARRDTRI
mmetsp:Transcript_12588/g.32181  ORF Transcript_12588/g.32181 Transcript_12588/m.32181 type:complete len:215 (+) Transcript_12588:1845-2489(+)